MIRLKEKISFFSIPLSVFVVSRFVVFLGLIFSGNIPHNPGLPAEGAGSIADLLMRWDSVWYKGIATSGYAPGPDGGIPLSVQFFPMYPLVAAALHKISGLSMPWSLFAISNSCFLAALVFLYIFVKENYGEERALWTVLFISFIPTSVFFSAGYTEAIALLFITLSFYLIYRKRFFPAALVIAMATATRFTMIALTAPLLWALIADERTRRNVPLTLGLMALSASGVSLYMLFLWHGFSDFFAFGSVIGHWQTRSYTFAETAAFVVVYREFVSALYWGFTKGFSSSITNFIGIFIFLAFLISSLWGLARYRRPEFLFAVLLLLLSYFGVASKMGLVSIGRYSTLAFPALVVISGLNARARSLLLAVLAALLPLYAALFARWYWIG